MSDNLLKHKKFNKLKNALSLHNIDENTDISDVINKLRNAEKYEKILITHSRADYAKYKFLSHSKKIMPAINKITSNIRNVVDYIENHKTKENDKQITMSSSLSDSNMNYSALYEQFPQKHHNNIILKIDSKHFVIVMMSCKIDKWLPIPFVKSRIIKFEYMLYHISLM